MVPNAVIYLIGVIAWTFLEYLIHAWLSHTFNTFVTPLHAVHHRDPHAVFAVGAWLPIALTWSGGIILFGPVPAMLFYSGIVTGFILYEVAHYRIHFAEPANRLEAYLRTRHLVHHRCAPDACHGVTSALWDLVFGSEPMGDAMRSMSATVATVPPLAGPSNLRRLLRRGIPAV